MIYIGAAYRCTIQRGKGEQMAARRPPTILLNQKNEVRILNASRFLPPPKMHICDKPKTGEALE